jgi:hypothetical protein
MDSKRLCTNYLDLQSEIMKVIADAGEQTELLRELTKWLEDHGADCIEEHL